MYRICSIKFDSLKTPTLFHFKSKIQDEEKIYNYGLLFEGEKHSGWMNISIHRVSFIFRRKTDLNKRRFWKKNNQFWIHTRRFWKKKTQFWIRSGRFRIILRGLRLVLRWAGTLFSYHSLSYLQNVLDISPIFLLLFIIFYYNQFFNLFFSILLYLIRWTI